ncbi:hypothetical protein [Tianweitania sediminis]|jgi:hypothetical protein|nr:hypothetical protein [Tianweitania sediminis]HEV7417717.1 hypothetical protein [Tianweitania sediminis]
MRNASTAFMAYASAALAVDDACLRISAKTTAKTTTTAKTV